MNLLVFNLKTDAEDDVLGFTTDWVNALAASCDRLFVITMSGGTIAVADNVQVYSVGKEKGYSEARRAAEFYRTLLRLLCNERIDACFAHMMPLFAVMGWPLLRLRGIPIVLWYAHSHVSKMLRVATPLVDRVVASSRSGFRNETDKLRIIGQGIDVNRFKPATNPRQSDMPFVLLTIGRIAPIKRLEILIQSMPLLPERLPDGRLIVARIVGNPLTTRDRQYANELRGLAYELGVTDRVDFLPAAPFTEVDGMYRDADVFVNSSDTDSIDKTVLEAMSCGLPVVTSNKAFADIFDEPYSGLRHVAKGNVGALICELESLIQMSQIERQASGLALRVAVCRDHSLNALSQRLMAQLTELTQKNEQI